jgi:hypothetical protein
MRKEERGGRREEGGERRGERGEERERGERRETELVGLLAFHIPCPCQPLVCYAGIINIFVNHKKDKSGKGGEAGDERRGRESW